MRTSTINRKTGEDVWEAVGTNSSFYGDWQQLLVPVSPGTYQVSVATRSNSPRTIAIKGCFVPGPEVLSSDGGKLAYLVGLGGREPSFQFAGGVRAVRLPIAGYLHDYREVIRLEYSAGLSGWADVDAEVAPYVDSAFRSGLEWSNPTEGDVDRGFYRFRFGP